MSSNPTLPFTNHLTLDKILAKLQFQKKTIPISSDCEKTGTMYLVLLGKKSDINLRMRERLKNKNVNFLLLNEGRNVETCLRSRLAR